MRSIAIIPAGGKGLRSGSATPKQYLKIKDKELIAYTLHTFQNNKLIDEIIIAAELNYHSLLHKLKDEYSLTKITKVVKGGIERQDSVHNALIESNADDDDLIIVHDAARPLLPDKILTNAIEFAKQMGNSVVCIKVSDTLIKGDEIIRDYLNRTEIYYVQTPQIFRAKDLASAMDNAYKNNVVATDESTLIKETGVKINIVEGSVFNFKITTEEDLKMFERLV